MNVSRTVSETTEDELLATIFPLLPRSAATELGPGDDAAVVRAPDGRFVVTTDVLVEDRHFRRRWSTGYDVGWRAAVQNLADVAAMGACPTSLVVSLVVPGDLEVAWVAGLARGLAAACVPWGAGVVGGDLSGGDGVVVAVTAHGDLEGRAPVRRSGARAGDVVAYAGTRGLSAAGLALAGMGRADLGADDDVARAAQGPETAAYLRPRSPLGAGAAAARAGATAMLDVSDGLLRDAGRVARASGVRIDLWRDAFAADAAALEDAARVVAAQDAGGPFARLGVDAWRGYADAWVLTGGEDHGLLATFPAGAAAPGPFRVVGQVLAPGEAAVRGSVTVDGRDPGTPGTGWDHFGG
ncbi:thiamine-phosphate kinase [Cellulomonas sp. PhB143]|uniref:thiamine-phosphate kinase n=1 Tax=Cellulomonas sp. PhB143 TaxID=2485186 RepID=UPI000F4877A4|nr:thiamine-phosphate kinase [Cellulomonas sp. PhB143]ROS73561.1 thiamine-phosphate kinase [Cellulomonas sp. PhB143]